ncbi:MAG: amidohydrolase, partial [Planctomycetes bacterium]|nr:amidohydrolase [Planctomycetota bacterium]
NDLPHRSRNPGAAHLCGHDAHTAMLLGAARVLSESRDRLRCSVRFLFQPNEEQLPGGAPAMIADGCLQGVDRVFGMHVWPVLDTGRIGLHVGPTMARPDNFAITLRGVGGHAAAPHHNRDVVVAAAHLVAALQSVVSRNLDPLRAGVVSVTQIHTGTADNVIPESAFVGGTIRSFDAEDADLMRARLEAIAEHTARAFEVEASIDYTVGYPVVLNDADACDEVEAAVSTVVPVTRDVTPTLGGEDFAYYQEKVRGAFIFLGNRDESQGIVHFCHHPRFRVDDNAMAHGVRTWVALARGARA